MSSSTSTPTPSQSNVSNIPGDADTIRVTLNLTVPRSQASSLLTRAKNIYVADALQTRGGDQTDTQVTLAASNFWDNNFSRDLSEACSTIVRQAMSDSGAYQQNSIIQRDVIGEYEDIIDNLAELAQRSNQSQLSTALLGCNATYNGQVLTIGTASEETRTMLQRSQDLPSFARQLFGTQDLRIDVVFGAVATILRSRSNRANAAQAGGGASTGYSQTAQAATQGGGSQGGGSGGSRT